MTVLHNNTTKLSARCITINIEGLHDVRLCQHRRCHQSVLQSLECFITLYIPEVLLLYLQKSCDEFSNLEEIQDESSIVTNQPEETADLMHSPWRVPI
jgi:hypothetical protein